MNSCYRNAIALINWRKFRMTVLTLINAYFTEGRRDMRVWRYAICMWGKKWNTWANRLLAGGYAMLCYVYV